MPMPDKPLQRMLLPVVLAMSLAGCATPLPPLPVERPRMPKPPPELMTPPEPGSWSDNVQELLRRWLPLLMPAKPA